MYIDEVEIIEELIPIYGEDVTLGNLLIYLKEEKEEFE